MKFRVEFGFGENVTAVDEWQTIDELNVIDAESYEESAKEAANIDGLENAIFRVCELTENEFGKLERNGRMAHFSFKGEEKMKKYIIVDDTTSKRSTIETYVFDSEKEAIEKAEQLISYLTKKEIEETDEFYIGIGEVNE